MTTRDLTPLAGTVFDLIVVGGGICGAAVAHDAAQRGMTVALLERGDFSGATSAESLKVVHGGIRYLQHLDVIRVRESSRERSALLRIAPHLVHPLPFVIPTYGHALRGRGFLGAGFAVLQLLTADRNRRLPDPARRIPRARLISRADVLAAFPQVEAAGLTGAGVYYDGQMYHPARLVWEFARTARQAGAVLANYCEVTELIRRDGRIVAVGVQDRLGGERFEVQSRMVANAAGPFAERLLVRAGLRPGRAIPFSRDMALVIRRQLVREGALALQTRYRDPDALLSRGNRHIFLVPWHGVTLIGVNSAIHRGDPDGLRVTRAEVEGFLAEINEADPRMGLTWDDIALVYAGLLPIEQGELVGDQVSFGKRAHVVDNAQADGVEGLVTAICNRYTTARGVAERVVDLVGRKLGRAAPCRTEVTPLYGGAIARIDDHIREVGSALPPGAGTTTAEQLARNHGSAYSAVLRLAAECRDLGVPIAGTGVLRAEVVHAVREELAVHLTDCVFRRTDLGTAGPPGEAALAECASLVAAELGWDEHRTGEELREVRQRYLVADG